MENGYCQDCKGNTVVVVFDHSTGDTICSECGLVLESHSIDQTSEWRTFANESNNNDPNRVGNRTNPLLSGSGLTTIISEKGASADSLTPSVGRWPNRDLNPDRVLIHAFGKIANMAEKLGLVTAIKDQANEIYKKLEDQKSNRARNSDAVLAACLFIACREKGLSRTLKEISTVANGATKKEINRAVVHIKKIVDVEMGTIQAWQLVRRFCSNLGMSNHAIKAVEETVQNTKEIDVRRSPQSILATVIFMITQLSDENKPLRDISLVSEVAVGTIRKSYKDLHPYASRLIPKWFAKEEDLKNLCSP